ncbi:MAG: hypothetical protein ACHREM_11365, partial [Polyangiales bacterium]
SMSFRKSCGIVAAIVALSVGCSQNGADASTDAGNVPDGDTSDTYADATPEVDAPSFEVADDALSPFDAVLRWDFVAPPVVACSDAGARDAAAIDAPPDATTVGDTGAVSLDPQCPLPPSVCAPDGSTLVYYEGGACVGAACQFTAKTLWCAGGCSAGGCGPGPTAH